MPRKARIIVPGSVHHVMARGLDRELIFRDNVDREKMLQLVERYFLAFRCACGLSPETALVGRRGEQWKRVRREFCSKANREYAYAVRELAEFLDVHASNVIRAMK